MQDMRVAIFTDTYLPEVNGVAKTLGRWVNYLESRGIACRVFAPESGDDSEDKPDRDFVHRFYSIPFLLYPELKLAIPNPFQIRKALREFEPTIVHAATPFNLGLFGLRYARKNNVPIVASYHTHFDQYLQHYKIQWVEPTLWRYMHWFHTDCRRIYVPSPSTKAYLEQKGMRGLEVWSRGVDTELFRPVSDREKILHKWNIPSDSFVLLYVGRLAPEKSVEVLLRAWHKLPADIRSRGRLVLTGDGPLAEELREMLPQNGHMIMTGFVQGRELAELYGAADLFVFPSATETFGNVVLESMAAGTPVIGAAAGGVLDNVQHNRTGLLCTPGSEEEFAAAIERLYRDGELRASMGRNAREYAEQQSWEQIFGRLLDSYRDVLEQESARVRGDFAN